MKKLFLLAGLILSFTFANAQEAEDNEYIVKLSPALKKSIVEKSNSAQSELKTLKAKLEEMLKTANVKSDGENFIKDVNALLAKYDALKAVSDSKQFRLAINDCAETSNKVRNSEKNQKFASLARFSGLIFDYLSKEGAYLQEIIHEYTKLAKNIEKEVNDLNAKAQVQSAAIIEAITEYAKTIKPATLEFVSTISEPAFDSIMAPLDSMITGKDVEAKFKAFGDFNTAFGKAFETVFPNNQCETEEQVQAISKWQGANGAAMMILQGKLAQQGITFEE
ncbi:hypothetical protein Emin_0856 [Elusimicrobium minutum Pei191]|uniref:Uncharacterized protein n=1 Tax=Elusimicrobium minutum (strain Pei191) TaxID=445932 RepID=B2KD15_ELUMP|nr:hypothetical protein [Elusimicrobium minutum]ACC98411.1 hypothetical protein Emin_0856 [Elusimicrobium minutum Pei191]